MTTIEQRAKDYAEKIYRRKLVKRKLTAWEQKNLKESRRKSYVSISNTQRAIDIEKALECFCTVCSAAEKCKSEYCVSKRKFMELLNNE